MATTALDYQILKTEAELDQLIEQLQQQPEFVFDFETTSLKTHNTELELVGLGFTWQSGQSRYVPFHHSIWGGTQSAQYPELVCLERQQELLQKFEVLFLDESIGKAGQNVKYDCRVLHRFGLGIQNLCFDTMVAHYALYSDRLPHNIDDIAMCHLGHQKIRTKHIIPKKTPKNPNPSMAQRPAEEVAVYCMEDCDYTWQAMLHLRELLVADPRASKLFYEIDMPLVEVLTRIECNGVQLDLTQMDAMRQTFAKTLTDLQAEINQVAGKPITLTNPAQLAELLYDQLRLDKKNRIKVRRTPSGARSTDAKTLARLSHEPVVQAIQKYKAMRKLQGDFITKLPQMVSQITGLLHASFNQTITSTSRLSSSEPNLQQVPQRTEEGKKIRECFVSRFEGGKILAADLSQAEMRILAHISEDPVLLDCYLNDRDMHCAAAALAYGITEDEVQPTQRSAAKTVNYGIIYGMSAKRLSNETGMTYEEADAFIKRYLANMRGVHQYIETTKKFLRFHGYVETLFGRRRYISKIFSDNDFDIWAAEREATNAPIQGFQADWLKIAMLKIDHDMQQQKLQSLMVMQVHDELVFDAHPDEFEVLKEIVLEHMPASYQLAVPMLVDAHYADSWAEAH